MQLNKYFGTRVFYKRALGIALPVMTQLLIQNLVSLIDNFMVAGLGDIKMSGVNIAGQISFIFFVLINAICMSGGIFIPQFKGANDKEGMQQAFRFKIIIAGSAGILFAVFSFAAPRNIFLLMLTVNKDAAVIVEQTIIYSKASALSFLFAVFSQSISSSLREIEIVKPPLVISISATLLNTLFNWLLIYGNLGAPRLEAAGAGYATVIARAFELFLFIVYVSVKKPDFLFRLTQLFRIKLRLFLLIIKKSTMILYSELTWAVSEIIATAIFNRRGGAEVVSGMSGGFVISNLFFICFSGIITACGVIIGQELGAGHLDKARKYKNWVLSGAVIFGSIFMCIGIFTTALIPYVFNALTPASREIARRLIITAALYLPLWAYLNGQYAVSRTGGDTFMGFFCDTAANILFVGGAFILAALTSLGPVEMFAIVKLSDFVKTLIAYFWLKKERWVVNLTSVPK